ncbi:hypothetical protein [Nostoc sp.]
MKPIFLWKTWRLMDSLWKLDEKCDRISALRIFKPQNAVKRGDFGV